MVLTPDSRAARSAAAMWAEDAASQWLGMEIVSVREGRAELTLTVAPHHCNGHGSCHGGVIFALADSAFAFACNSRNIRAVAQHNTITYLTPAQRGDTLIARAVEQSHAGRTRVCDVQVSTQTGTRIAEFRGISRDIGGQHFDEVAEAAT